MSVEVLKQIWPEWELEEKILGRGSYGVVYKAVRRDYNVESYAAIKEISIPSDPSELDSLRSEGLDMNAARTYLEGIVQDFVNEIRLMESLKGIQNIVSVEDYKVVEKIHETGWDIYIRMELLTPFQTYLCDKKMSEEEIIRLGCDICTALEICARRNIIHRDIKPENIFVNDFGHFKLGDFGIARKLENMTGGFSQKGTFHYMAPEVVNGNKYDARVDLYSLGLVLYRLCNGNRLPFLDTEKQLLSPNERRNANERRMRGEALPAPCEASPALADLILRACAFDPGQRFSSAAEMRQALEAVADGTYRKMAGTPEKTTAVRSSLEHMDHRNQMEYADHVDHTISVRKAPDTADRETASPVSTFGSVPKKKGRLRGVLITVLAVVVLAGAGVFVWPESGGGAVKVEKEGTFDDVSSETEKDTRMDEEQTAVGMEEADQSASEEDEESTLAEPQTGDTAYPESVFFGAYEQDNDISNGKEEIEWLVLDVQDGKVLLISKYGLDCKPYHGTSATWENCTLRQWLNYEFMDAAFSDEEKSLIATVTVSADRNPEYDTDPGNATQDQVFLLSIPEVKRYFSTEVAMQCRPTDYAVAKGVDNVYDNGNCWWWLRSPGSDQVFVASVFPDGGICVGGIGGFGGDFAIRPALWIDLGENNILENELAEINNSQENSLYDAKHIAEKLQDIQVGGSVSFGTYEQDNDTSNGGEEIEWLVLGVQDEKALLISKYGLECKPYHTEEEAVTWETCSLRQWLNGEFMDDAFSDEEKARIPTVTVSADRNPEHDTDSGNATQDQVFLLSIPEVNQYLISEAVGQCRPTDYAVANGVLVSNENCCWWLRSPGLYQYTAAAAFLDDGVLEHGFYVNDVGCAVRPALWINLAP